MESEGFTALSIISIPLLIMGEESYKMLLGTVFMLGIKLNALSTEKGRSSLAATIAHIKHAAFFGAFFKNGCRRIMIIAIQPAAILKLNTFKNRASTSIHLRVQ